MFLRRYEYNGQTRVGLDRDGTTVDLRNAYEAWAQAQGQDAADPVARVFTDDLLDYFEAGDNAEIALNRALEYVNGVSEEDAVAAGLVVNTADTRTLVPMPRPPKIICVARNFAEHAREAGLPVSEIPILFIRFPNTQIADGDYIEVPTVSEQVDWEGEVAVIIGKGGRHIAKEDAMDHVAGYTIFNDVSVRDYQFRVAQYTGGKNFDTSAPIGPAIRLKDDEFDPHATQIVVSINDVVKQDGNTRDFIFDIPTIVEHISEFVSLEAGDVIAMGTPAGVGFKRTPPEFLTEGDVVSVAVEGLGVLSNPVRNER